MELELEQLRMDKGASTTFDELSMERSKSFVKALQELKNLRPQLYSAAEYCEKSYLHSDQKQMVLDNLKDYAVRTLINAVDHLGTVAYKLTDLLDQQSIDVSTMELKVSEDEKTSGKTYGVFHLVDAKESTLMKSPAAHLKWSGGGHASSTARMQNLCPILWKDVAGFPYVHYNCIDSVQYCCLFCHLQDSVEGSRPLTPFRSHVNPSRREIVQAPIRSKSLLSSFFVKHKTTKHKTFS
ncbi:hypothetical protein C3L33_04995, partial [Rhododendron williamsianum]